MVIVEASDQQSGPQQIGSEYRVVQKQDGEIISPDRSDPYGQD